MKNILSVILYMVFLPAIGQNLNKTDLLKLKGNIKSFKINSYKAVFASGKIEKGEPIINSIYDDIIHEGFKTMGDLAERSAKLVLNFNNKGFIMNISNYFFSDGLPIVTNYKRGEDNKILEEITYFSDNSYWKTSWKYNSYGDNSEQNSYDENGNYEGNVIYNYDSNGNLIEEIHYDKKHELDLYRTCKYDIMNRKIEEVTKKIKSTAVMDVTQDLSGNVIAYHGSREQRIYDHDKYEYFYDNNGKLTEKKDYGNTEAEIFDGTYSLSTFSYNEYGQKVKEIIFYSLNLNDTSQVKTYVYNDKGNIILIHDKWYSFNLGIHIYSFEYYYDDKANWIKGIASINGNPKYILERQIEYY